MSHLTPIAKTPEMINTDVNTKIDHYEPDKPIERLIPFDPEAGLPKRTDVIIIRPLEDNEVENLIWNRHPGLPKLISGEYKRVGTIGDSNCLFHCILKTISELYNQSYYIPQEISEYKLRTFEQQSDRSIYFDSSLFDAPRTNDLRGLYKVANIQGYKDRMKLWRMAFASVTRKDLAQKVRENIDIQKRILDILPGTFNMYYDNMKLKNSEVTQEQVLKTIYGNISTELLTRSYIPVEYFLILSEYIGYDLYVIRDQDIIDPRSTNSILYGGDVYHKFVRGPRILRNATDTFLHEKERKAMVVLSYSDNHFELVGKTFIQGDKEKALVSFTQDEPLIQILYQIVADLRRNA